MAQALENLRRAQDKQKTYANKKRRELELQVGDEILLSTRNLPMQVAVGGIRAVVLWTCYSIGKTYLGLQTQFTPTYASTTCVPCFPVEIVQEASTLLRYQEDISEA